MRSERGFCEQLDYNLLFRWFLGMNLMEPSFDPTVFTKNRERLLKHRVGQALFDEVVLEADRPGLLSDEHFTVDGTLIEAAASLKSFKPKDGDPPKTTDDDPGNPSVDFHGERRSNATHQSTTDPEARLLRKGKGKEAKLVFMAHALMENRHGLLVDFQTTQATGTAERDTVPVLVDQAKERGFHPKTLGGDKGYDTGDCVAALRQRGLTPHVAQNTNGRSSAIDGRTTRHPGYAISQRIRKRVEEIFGWMKTVGGFRRTRYKEEVYLKAYQNGTEARKGIGAYLAFYNQERPHQALGYRSPGQVFHAVSPQRCLLELPQALQSGHPAGPDRSGGVPGSYGLQSGPHGEAIGVGQGSAGSPGGMTRKWATHARCPRRAGSGSVKGQKSRSNGPIPPNRTNDSQT